MAKIFVTGSADGLGRRAAQELLRMGHHVTVHVRSASRLEALGDLIEGGAVGVVGDLAVAAQVSAIAAQVNELGAHDAVIHNAGVLDGPSVLQVNVLAPYVLTALIHRPRRLIYLSSSMHADGRATLDVLGAAQQGASVTYSDTKLLVTTLAAALARRWPEAIVSAVDPGWVPTKMGGSAATDDLRRGHLTQEWLATSEEPEALISGAYWHHQTRRKAHPAVTDVRFQDALLEALARHTGVQLPDGADSTRAQSSERGKK
jgi:NAD(P)-dependent dehydrogenase (short-subunit alcohol dehydrogenase family)